MIYGIIHKGSGLGNQLHRYVATRVLALDNGYDFGFVAPGLFKGISFMKPQMGTVYEEYADIPYTIEEPAGKVVAKSDIPLWVEGTDYYNPEFNFISDNTIIDGEFQDERYFGHRLPEIREWLKTEYMDMPDDLCVIGFRGGEFAIYPDLFLTPSYWLEAISIMKGINPKMRFEVHTDDPGMAKRFFPEYKIIHDISINWRSIRYAKYSIIANSSFYILPSLLNDKAEKIIAPRYWARRNTAVWSMPQNYYKKFHYI
jgi:hypothetical protein